MRAEEKGLEMIEEEEMADGFESDGAQPHRRRRACRPRARPPAAASVRARWWGEENGARVLQGMAACGFVRPIRADDRRMAIQADQRPAAAGSWRASFRPRRARGTGCFGGPAVGCWALGPSGRELMAVGHFLPGPNEKK
jgi:hypothetical protein